MMGHGTIGSSVGVCGTSFDTAMTAIEIVRLKVGIRTREARPPVSRGPDKQHPGPLVTDKNQTTTPFTTSTGATTLTEFGDDEASAMAGEVRLFLALQI